MLASKLDLAEAMSRVAAGDRAAFNMVYAATSVKLFGIVVRILGRRDLAEEALQDTYVRVWQRAAEYDPTISSPMTWLVAIARHRALDEAKRKPMRSIDDCPEVLQIPSGDDPAANQERNEELLRVMVCLDGLEPEKKKLVLLAYYYGLTREEIARATDRPAATVKTWLRRSLAQLKDCLGQ